MLRNDLDGFFWNLGALFVCPERSEVLNRRTEILLEMKNVVTMCRIYVHTYIPLCMLHVLPSRLSGMSAVLNRLSLPFFQWKNAGLLYVFLKRGGS